MATIPTLTDRAYRIAGAIHIAAPQAGLRVWQEGNQIFAADEVEVFIKEQFSDKHAALAAYNKVCHYLDQWQGETAGREGNGQGREAGPANAWDEADDGSRALPAALSQARG